MTDLRYFGDIILQAIEHERRLNAIGRNADAYGAACKRIRQDCLEARDLDSNTITAASEGINAVRIIMEEPAP